MSVQSSLFESAPEPVMQSSTGWLINVLVGELAVGLCVIAVAFLGALMLTGRLPVRSSLRVVLGCFVLLGAPVLAAAFMEFAGVSDDAPIALTIEPDPTPPRANAPPANYDPYAGAAPRIE